VRLTVTAAAVAIAVNVVSVAFASVKVAPSLQNSSAADPRLEEMKKGTGIEEHLGRQIPISALTFRDESGAEVSLAKYFASGKPVLLSLVYYACPHLCTFVLNGMVDGLKQLEWVPGEQFEVVSVSIDSKEGPKLAAEKKSAYLEALGRKGPDQDPARGWHFLTGTEANIKKLASEIGFGYRYDQVTQQYAHSAGIFVLTPAGVLSRVLYGIEYRPQDLRLALLEASDGRVGTVIDRIVLFCFQYDPVHRGYALVATRVMRLGAGLTVLVLAVYLGGFWWRQNRRRRQERERHTKHESLQS